MMNMIDCASSITEQIASTLKSNNVSHVGRYLYNGWKGLTLPEVQTIKDAGLNLLSIYETNPTYTGYFTKDQGIQDANDAFALAQDLGQPEGTAIYFTVDFDAQTKDFVGILNYFQGIHDTLKSYKIGCYGKYQVVQLIQTKKLADYFYQTYAWSSGQHASGIHIFQYKNDINQYGLNCDLDYIENTDCGSWFNQPSPSNSGGILTTVQVLNDTDIRSEPDHASGFIRNASKGELYNVIGHLNPDWHQVLIDDHGNNGWIDGANGQNLLDVKNGVAASQTQNYKIQDGDTLIKIAGIFKTSVQNILTLNPNISNPNKINAGQTIIVPK